MEKKYFDYGREMSDAFSELASFEKTFKPILEKKISEFESLESQAEKLESKLTAERIIFDQKKNVFFASLREAEIKIRSDARREFEKLTAAGKKYSDEDFESAVVDALEPKAKKITSLREPELDKLRLELALAKIRRDLGELSQWPFEMRRQAARNFLLSVFSVAGFTMKYEIGNSSFPEAKRWSDEIKKLDERLQIAEGKLKSFETVGLAATSANELLEFACYLPAIELTQVMTAWKNCKLSGGTGFGISFDQRKKITWRFTKAPGNESKHITQSSDFSGGSTSRYRKLG